jgi:phosphopantothenoylcysteine decarboxylase
MLDEKETMENVPEPEPTPTPRRRMRILLGITGSVAGVKGPELACRLSTELDADVTVLLTRAGRHFWELAETYDPFHWERFKNLQKEAEEEASASSTAGVVKSKIVVYYAEDEWSEWKSLGDPVLHIELRNWADVLVVAPLSAHTLAKFATGFCDDPLSCCMRAWDMGHNGHNALSSTIQRKLKPIILAPAMNTVMWNHPLTRRQLKEIQSFSNCCSPTTTTGGTGTGGSTQIVVVEPKAESILACGEVGAGALADLGDIVRMVRQTTL